MPPSLIRYELDPTGINNDNRVENEPHTLTSSQVRAVTPLYGPFFTNNLQVFDVGNGQLLTRGTHFQCVELLQEATLKYGKEICSVVLIIDPLVSSNLSVNYNALGGLYQNDSTAIANLYEAVINDNRQVLWENVLNKPIEYPPTLHRHLLDDLFGFEYVVAALERIRNAILLTDVPAFEALLDLVDRRIGQVRCREVLQNLPNKKIISFSNWLVAMTQRYLLSNYRFGPIPEVIYEGNSFVVEIQTQNVPNNTVFYWNIVHDGTVDADFLRAGGQAIIQNNRAFINIQLINDTVADTNAMFAIGLKYSLSDTDYMALSCNVESIVRQNVLEDLSIYDLAVYPDMSGYVFRTIGMTPARLFFNYAKSSAIPVGHPNRTYVPGVIPFDEYLIDVNPEMNAVDLYVSPGP